MSAAQPTLPGAGVTVRILRDDGIIFAGVTVAGEFYAPGRTNAKLAAATGLSAAEVARALNAPTATNRQPREPSMQGIGWAIYNLPGSVQCYVLRDDGTHLSFGAGASLFTPGKAVAALLNVAGLSAAEIARVNSIATPAAGGTPTPTPSGALLAELQAATSNAVALFWDPNSLTPQANLSTIDVGLVCPVSGMPLTPNVIGQRMRYKDAAAAALNGKALANTDGLRSFLTNSDARLGAVISRQSTITGFTMIYCLRATIGATGGNAFRAFFGVNSVLSASTMFFGNDSLNMGGIAANIIPGGNSGMQIVTHTGSTPTTGSVNQSRKLGLAMGTVTVGAAGVVPTNLGASGENNSSYGMIGDMGVICGFNRELTNAEMVKVNRLLHAYYGLTVPWAAQAVFPCYDGDSYLSIIAGWNNVPQVLSALKGYSPRASLSMAQPSRSSNQNAEMIPRYWAGLEAELRVDNPTIKCVHLYQEFYNQPDASAAGVIAYETALKSQCPEITSIFLNAWDNGNTSGATFTARAAYNTTSVSGSMPADFKIDISADVNMGIEGACPNTPGPYGTYFTDFAGHPSAAGALYVRDFVSSTWDAAVAAAT